LTPTCTRTIERADVSPLLATARLIVFTVRRKSLSRLNRWTTASKLALGNTIIRVLHTPGHTPESICLLVCDLRREPDPWFVCTRYAFRRNCGQPNLPGRTEQGAAELYASLHQKLLSLPDEIEVYPAHFAGSACGVEMSGKPSSTIAFEKRWDTLLSLSADEFIAQVGQGIPPKPAGMEAIMQFNRGESA
jgi:hydroxyacylglutathione hydrolase